MKKIATLLLCGTLSLISSFAVAKMSVSSVTPDSTHYAIYFGDREAGSQVTWQSASHTYHSIYEYNDRGRGPYYEETIRVSDKGLITEVKVSGHDYLKDSVSEAFTIQDGQAVWESTSEAGSAAWNEQAMYSPGSGSFMPTGLLVKYLLSQQNRATALLPAGEAQIVDVSEHTFADSLQLKLVTITGFSFSPYYIWVDRNNDIFAYLYTTWFALCRKGYEDLRPDMLRIQTQSIDKYFDGLTASLQQTPEKQVAITGVTLFDPKSKTYKDNMTVVLEGNRISMVGPTAAISLPRDSQIINGMGKTLLPGLFDMHTHIGKSDGILHLAAGVTSVRDLGNTLELPALQKQFNENELIGPRIVMMAGFIDKAGPYAGPTGKTVKTLEEGLEAVSYYHEKGYGQVKLYSSIEPEWVAPMAARAHELGMRVSGHIPAFMTAEEAVRAGYDEIQHANMVLLNFMPDTLDTRTPLRFTHVGEHGHEVDVESEDFEEFIRLLQKEKVVLDPTVSIFESMLKGQKGKADPSMAAVIDRLPVQTRRAYYGGGLPVTPDKREAFDESFERMLDIVKKAHEAGITIVPGTDATAGFALHRELENYVKAGLSPAEVLQMATLTSAELAGVQKNLGTIEKGKLADMILVDGNPAENISDIRRVVLTIKDGKLYDPEMLYKSIGVTWIE